MSKQSRSTSDESVGRPSDQGRRQQQQQQARQFLNLPQIGNDNNFSLRNVTTSLRQQRAAPSRVGAALNGNLCQTMQSFSPLINAPTSLTNLAQLSGISLMPMAVTRDTANQQTTNSQQQYGLQTSNNNVRHGSTISFDNPRQQTRVAASMSGQNTLRIPQNNLHIPILETDLDVGLSTLAGVGQHSRISGQLDNCSSTFDVSAIPSIQSLKQATIESSHWKPTGISAKNQVMRTQNQLKQQPIKNTYQASPRLAVSSGQQSHNRTATQSVGTQQQFSNNLTDFASSMNQLQQSMSQSSMSIDLEPSGGAFLDMNNFSLMKLMAILNNPALTITPVSGSPKGMNGNMALNQSQLESGDLLGYNNTNNNNNNDPFSTDSTQNNAFISYSNSGPSNLSVPFNLEAQKRNRVPKSAANLQVIYGSQLASSSKTPLNRTKDDRKSMSNDLAGQSKTVNTQKQVSNNNQAVGGSSTDSTTLQSQQLSDTEKISESIRRLVMEQVSTGASDKLPTIQLIKHGHDQTLDDSQLSGQSSSSRIAFQADCIPTTNRCNADHVCTASKTIDHKYVVESNYNIEKEPIVEPKGPTKRRLFVPEAHHVKRRKISKEEPEFGLFSINIIDEPGNELFVSERHSMLHNLMPDEFDKKQQGPTSEPDEIFMDRSKKIMSKIDTELEKRKRKRFERICGRFVAKKADLDDPDFDSDTEFSDDEDITAVKFTPIRLPLEETPSEEKRKHLLSVGLVSRNDKNAILIDQCEKKMNLISPLSLEVNDCADQEVQRFVDTIIKTGGTDIQFRTESSIKRNDLPLIEGLNRNTSRVKMTYMSALGLEKRSKRTTLYKVRGQENSSMQFSRPQSQLQPTQPEIQNHQQQNDLNNQPQSSTAISNSTSRLMETLKQNGVSLRPYANDSSTLQAPKRAYLSCREAIPNRSKDEYMKSLGLMAS